MCFKAIDNDDAEGSLIACNFGKITLGTDQEANTSERQRRRRPQREPVIDRVVNFSRDLFRRIGRRVRRRNTRNSAVELVATPNSNETSSRPGTPTPRRELRDFSFPIFDPEPIGIVTTMPSWKNKVKKPVIDQDKSQDDGGAGMSLQLKPSKIELESKASTTKEEKNALLKPALTTQVDLSPVLEESSTDLLLIQSDDVVVPNIPSSSNLESSIPSDKNNSDNLNEETIKPSDNNAEDNNSEKNEGEPKEQNPNKSS